MKKSFDTFRVARGFSLAEVLAALTIGAMVLVAVLGIYNRAERSAAAITRKLESGRLPSEVLQRIAEDIDRMTTAGSDTKITIENKFEKGFSVARLIIEQTIYDKKNKKQTFETIVWQSNIDNDANGLVLYRSHGGMVLEDKLLDEQKQSWARELFVPICTGITFFKVQVPTGGSFQDKWTSSSLPLGIVVTISFAEPFKTLSGTLDVPDTEKITRAIAVDRTRKINFTFVKKEYEDEYEDEDKKNSDSGRKKDDREEENKEGNTERP
jgi:prepilin-type N-terminal cleavage/methylation domain-containing protein